MAKVFFNTIYYLTIGAVGLIGLLLVGTLVPIPGNFEVKVVKSGSMEPTIRVGSIVVIKPEASYKVGDVVTFGADTKTQIPTTHRIVAAEGQGSSEVFHTKGDANDSPDNTTVRLSDIHGKEVLTVPYLGYILAFARTQLGFFLLVGVPAILVFLEEGKNIFLEIKRMRRGRYAKRMPVPIKPSIPSEGIPSGYGYRRIKIMSLILVAGLLAGGAGSAGLRGDTVAYYADKAVSLGNSLGAADDFTPIEARLVVSFSEPQLASLTVGDTGPSSEETPKEDSTETSSTDTPPPEELVVELSEPVIVEETPAETPTESQTETPPEPVAAE